MRNNETGEYELVVGNKQLLSGFFIVVLLCAVAFAMGYVVGENSHTVKAPEMASAGGSPSKAVDPRPEAASPAAPAPAPPRSETADPPPAEPKGTPADNSPQPTTRPARDVEPEAPKRKPPEPKPAPPEPRPAPPEQKGTPESAPGQFWQVTATTNRDSAENLLQSLKEKGFPATLSPGPNNFTRVLVGPYPDTAAMGKAKTDLESAGFSKLVRK